MKKIIITLLLVSIIAAPSYAVTNQNPIKKIWRKVTSFFRESPVAKQRRQIQEDYNNGKISQQECDSRLAEFDRTQESYKELNRQLAEQRKQAAEQRTVQ